MISHFFSESHLFATLDLAYMLDRRRKKKEIAEGSGRVTSSSSGEKDTESKGKKMNRRTMKKQNNKLSSSWRICYSSSST